MIALEKTVYKKKECAKAAIRKALKTGNRSEYDVRPVDGGGFQIFQIHNTAKAPSLQFGEPGKDRFRYADGAHARYAIGPSTRYDSKFTLFSRAEGKRRFKFEARYKTLEDALNAAQRADED